MNPLVMALVRLIVPIFGVFNMWLVAKGYNPLPFSEEDVSAFIIGAVTVLTTFWAWWKNNNITKAAQKAQVNLDIMKENPKHFR